MNNACEEFRWIKFHPFKECIGPKFATYGNQRNSFSYMYEPIIKDYIFYKSIHSGSITFANWFSYWYYSRPKRSVYHIVRSLAFDLNHLFVKISPFWLILLNNCNNYSNSYKLKTVKLVSFWRFNFFTAGISVFLCWLLHVSLHFIPATCLPNITCMIVCEIKWYVMSPGPVNICCKRMYYKIKKKKSFAQICWISNLNVRK